jgi:hypothetical protein
MQKTKEELAHMDTITLETVNLIFKNASEMAEKHFEPNERTDFVANLLINCLGNFIVKIIPENAPVSEYEMMLTKVDECLREWVTESIACRHRKLSS